MFIEKSSWVNSTKSSTQKYPWLSQSTFGSGGQKEDSHGRRELSRTVRPATFIFTYSSVSSQPLIKTEFGGEAT